MSKSPLNFQIHFPDELPVSARRAEIAQAIEKHQVVIVCGETGSGKTTQLPKIALSLGRGLPQSKSATTDARNTKRRHQRIGHTQPRRIAASTVAKRIAYELNTPLGELVGYKVRFQDRLSDSTCIKLMTDGILLAETQTDPDLLAYDTLIIDEAHERSLNIDFLLGYIQQLLPRRPDLKVIVTSATIDADRFAQYFASRHGAAPVITVSGRLYPVEQRYRPFEERKDFSLNDAVADAVDELWREPSHSGDILVFMPGEREIRDAADHLRGHFSHSAWLRSAEVLPLFARLSPAEQERVFEPSGARRVVLATNVAETSLTVPGIRYVIDVGTARVKRYSFRQKVEQLLIEPISQAAANQRAGRCGRVANGICIRLYDEKEFALRPAYTDPEILRSSLAAVILRMKALHLPEIEDFHFMQAPSSRAIGDGYQLLAELGAIDEAKQLTQLGQSLAKLPLDPRIGRMILEAKHNGALAEVLVIAAALSVQDVRDRPLEAQAAADQAHAKFDDEKSEFSGYIRLWQWLETARGGNSASKDKQPTSLKGNRPFSAQANNQTHAQANTQADTHKLSNRQFEALLRQNFINPRRLREWRDTHSQLNTLMAELGWRSNRQPATYEQLHLSLLAGLLGNVGCKGEEDEHYLGARGIKFYKHPGANLSKKPGRWVMCAELVETTRLFGRGIANIEVAWIEKIASHLMKRQCIDPHWEKKSGQVVALERGTLYGLVVYNNRRIRYANLDPADARDIFIRQALVGQDWPDNAAQQLPFLQHNQKLIAQVQDLEHKARRQDVLVDDELIAAFYDQHLPAEAVGMAELTDWWRGLERVPKDQQAATHARKQKLFLQREELMRHEAAGITTEAFPKLIRLGGVDCAARYLHEPSHAQDGVTVTIPLFALNQVNEQRCDWLVMGMLREKVQTLLKSLPQKPRARLVPLPQNAQAITEHLSQSEVFAHGAFMDALLKEVRRITQMPVQASDFKQEQLNAHSRMNLLVVDEHGRQLGMGRSLSALKSQLGTQASGAFQALASLRVQDLGSQNDAGLNPSQPSTQLASNGKANNNSTTAKAASNALASTAKDSRANQVSAKSAGQSANQRYTDWTFGDWPELLEIEQGGHSIIGFAALHDVGDAVVMTVLDEPEAAQRQHCLGLRRLFALQVKEALKSIEKNLPDWQKTAVAFMPLGSADELKNAVLNLALDRTFLEQPLPQNASEFKARVQEGRTRLSLIAQEVARSVAAVMSEYSVAARKIKDSKATGQAAADCAEQLQRLVHKHFVRDTAWTQLQHLPRYLKAIVMRLEKYRADPARDTARMAELKLVEQRYWRLSAERKGNVDARMSEYRWLLEELRVSLFAQELRTPQPVSVKRLEKAWQALLI